jgi:hypothetical protein
MPEPSAGTAWSNFARFLGRALLFFSMFIFLFSGYLAFAHYWIQTQWVQSEATVLSGEIRQSSSGSTTRPSGTGASSHTYVFHCTVSYPVAGEARQSELDSPPSPYPIDAQVWAATWSPGQHLAIRYMPSNPSKIRMADNPAELTAMGSFRFAFYFLVPGVLLILTSRPDRVNSQ